MRAPAPAPVREDVGDDPDDGDIMITVAIAMPITDAVITRMGMTVITIAIATSW